MNGKGGEVIHPEDRLLHKRPISGENMIITLPLQFNYVSLLLS